MLREEHVEQFVARFIKSGDVVSIGTSRLGEVFLKKLALALHAKHIDLEKVEFVPTSNHLAVIASQLHLPLASLNESEIDVAIEFVDFVDSDFNFIKKDSFSLVRDKMIAQSAGNLIVVLEGKGLLKTLRGKPILFEITTFGWKRTVSQLSMFGRAKLVEVDGKPKKTESGNYLTVVECDPSFSLEELENETKHIPGVLETGLFLGYADKVLIHNKHLKLISRSGAGKKAFV